MVCYICNNNIHIRIPNTFMYVNICPDCFRAARDMVSFLNNLKNDSKGGVIENQNKSTDSQLNSSSKGIAAALEWMKETKETSERLMKEMSERLNFLDGFVVGVRDGIQSDIQVKPGNGLPIPAHRAVLALRSDIFKNMLESDGCKAAPIDTISLPELDHDVLESLIEFLYDGNLAAKKIEKHVYSLFIAADKYEIPYLQKFCEHQILKSLDSSNAFDVLEISDVCRNMILKEAAMSFLLKNKDDIVFSTKFDEFARKNPYLTVEITRALFRENNSKRQKFVGDMVRATGIRMESPDEAAAVLEGVAVP